jgi:hypothetical protein
MSVGTEQQTELSMLHADDQAATSEKFPAEIQNLPPEMRTMVSVMAGFFRSNSGPDAETAKIMAEAEMHEESCKLQAYTQSMKNRDLQNERDHLFRMKKLLYDNVRSFVIGLACIGGIICGLYLTVKMGNSAVGNPVLLASFLALLGVKPNFNSKDKE